MDEIFSLPLQNHQPLKNLFDFIENNQTLKCMKIPGDPGEFTILNFALKGYISILVNH